MNALLVIIKAIGLIMAVLGAVFAAVPRKLVKVFPFFKAGKKIYAVGVCRLVCAVIFLLAASQARWSVVIGLFGILLLISGVLIFALKLKHIRAVLDWFPSKPDMVLRAIGVVVLIIGLLIVFAA